MTQDDLTRGSNGPRSKLEEDFFDHQNELAGADVGRQPRFLSEPNTSKAIETRKNKDRERLSRLLELLERDPQYAALYSKTMDLLSRAEAATERALENAETALEEAKEELDELTQKASAFPDGTPVFRDAQGVARYADGKTVSDEDSATIHWRVGAPTYEDYLTRKKAYEQAQQSVDDIRRYQVDVLGDARNRLTDPDNPLSVDDLHRLQKDIEDKAPPSMKAELAPDVASSMPPTELSASATLPKL